MSSKEYFLVFGINTFLSIKKDDVLIINTITNKRIEIRENKKLKEFFEQDVCRISDEDLKDEDFNFIINKITTSEAGKLVPVDMFENQELKLLPDSTFRVLFNENDFSPEVIENEIYPVTISLLQRVHFFVNTVCELNCSFCNSAYKQFLCCRKQEKEKELEFETIKNFLVKEGRPITGEIVISGGNIFQYSHLNDIILLANRYFPKLIFVFNYLNVHDDFSIFNKFNSKFEIIVECPVNEAKIEELKLNLEKAELSGTFSFVVSSEADIEYFEEIIEKHKIENYTFTPFYNEKNFDFFEKNLFTDSEEINKAYNSIYYLFKKRYRNMESFYKLMIDVDGSVYTNLNTSALGNIKELSFNEILEKEIERNGDWYRTRSKVEPCKKCLYTLICPPLGNYEYALERNNLCNISR